jgi:hypothetical protein
LFYLRHNVEVVGSQSEAQTYLNCHPFSRGVLIYLDRDYRVTHLAAVTKISDSCPARVSP